MTVRTDHVPLIFSYPTPRELGRHAGERAAVAIRHAIGANRRARVLLAAAPSQAETLAALVCEPGIDWGRVELFHMDDYIGLPPGAPQSFSIWLRGMLVDQLPPETTFHPMDPSNDPEGEVIRYERLMGDDPFDLVMLGLGVNGHLAFNDPPADLLDRRGAKVVTLDDTSRRQQVDEGHFAAIEDVPRQAITVTIPRLLNAHELIASVPGAQKRRAVADTLARPSGPVHPGTALRTHPRVRLFLDTEADPR